MKNLDLEKIDLNIAELRRFFNFSKEVTAKELKDTISSFHADFNSLSEQLISKEQKVVDTTKELQARQQELNNTKNKLHIQQDELADIRNKLQNTTHILDETKVNLKSKEKDIANLNQELKTQQQALVSKKEELQIQIKEVDDLKNKLQITIQTLEDTKKNLTSKEQELSSTEKELHAQKEETVDVKNKLQNTTQTLDKIQAKYDLVRGFLSAKASPSDAFIEFQKLLNKDFLDFANEESSLAEEAKAILMLQDVEKRLNDIVSFPAIYNKNIVAVGGGFSAGKSAFLNSLFIDKQLKLPVGINPVTAIPTYITTEKESKIKGYSYNGGIVELSLEQYRELSHDFIKSLGFNLKDIAPLMAIETQMESHNNICFIDTPGYNPSDSGFTSSDNDTSKEYLEHSNTLLWTIGIDTNGTIPTSDLDFLENISLNDKKIYIIANKADLRGDSDIEDILDVFEEILEEYEIKYEGISAFSSVNKEELTYRKVSLFEFLEIVNSPVNVQNSIYDELNTVFDMYKNALNTEIERKTKINSLFKSLELDLLESGIDIDKSEKVDLRLSEMKEFFTIHELQKQAKTLEELREKIIQSAKDVFVSIDGTIVIDHKNLKSIDKKKPKKLQEHLNELINISKDDTRYAQKMLILEKFENTDNHGSDFFKKNFSNIPLDIKNDKEFILKIFKYDYYYLFDYLVGDSLKNDKEFILEVVKQKGQALQYASDSIKDNRDVVLEAVKQNGWALQYASDTLKADRDIVLEAIKQYSIALQFASDNLKSDKHIVLEAIKQNGLTLAYVSNDLKSDKKIVLEAIKQNGEALQYANDDFKSDRDIVLEAVKQKGRTLQFASDELKSNENIVLEAVKQDGIALDDADDKLKSDRDIVLEAVKQNGRALQYVNDKLKSDRKIVLEAVKQNGWALQYVNDTLKADRDIVLEAIKQDGIALDDADDKLKSDRDIVLEAVKQKGWALRYANDKLKSDREIVLEAVKQNGRALQFADDELKSNENIVSEAVKESSEAIAFTTLDIATYKLPILHILHKISKEEKLLYTQAIAIFFADNLTKQRVESIYKIAEILHSDLTNELIDSEIQNPKIDEKETMFSFLKTKKYYVWYILDLLYIAQELNQEDKERLDIVRYIFNISNKNFDILTEFGTLVVSDDKQEILNKSKEFIEDTSLPKYIRSLVKYHFVDIKEKIILEAQYQEQYQKYNKISRDLTSQTWEYINELMSLTKKFMQRVFTEGKDGSDIERKQEKVQQKQDELDVQKEENEKKVNFYSDIVNLF